MPTTKTKPTQITPRRRNPAAATELNPEPAVEKTPPKVRAINCPNCLEPVVIRRDIAVTPPPRQLTEFQEHLFNLLGDLALNGGDSDELHRMLYAAMAHSWRRRFGHHGEPREETDRSIATYVSNHEEEWMTDLVRSWPKAKDRPAANPRVISSEFAISFSTVSERPTLALIFTSAESPQRISVAKIRRQ